MLENSEISNKIIDRLPDHLKQFIKPQEYSDYTAIDQAVWRHVMHRNIVQLQNSAHHSYLDGLKKTGVSLENIPSIYGMNRILKEIGWAAVAVDGFIPPNAFMEFQAHKILVIASDIRQLEHIEYTPAPDIIHESSGHAPIIANPDYAEFLRRLGEIGAKAIVSKHDMLLYEAVRALSILKEHENSTAKEIKEAEDEVSRLQRKKEPLSEMAKIRNMQWWSVEYGLIGSLHSPKIYGAGLLSSIGESEWCLSDKIKKLPYSLDVVEKNFDITKPQPQLYVTPNFPYLMEVLEEFANTLSVRTGGAEGLKRLIKSETVGSVELSTGLQVSGIFSKVIENNKGEVVFFKTYGPTALSYRDKELVGHGVKAHPDGFSSPLGQLKSINLPLEDMSPVELKNHNFNDGKRLYFEFESGVCVEGLNVTGLRNVKGKIMIIQLTDCTVTYKEEVLFKPEYGTYDMAIGTRIISAFAGAADHLSFPNLYNTSPNKTKKTPQNNNSAELIKLYQKVRDYRLNKKNSETSLTEIFYSLKKKHPKDWLLCIEILELSKKTSLKKAVTYHLQTIAKQHAQLKELILKGLELTLVK